MNKLFLAAIILLFGCTSAFADVYNYSPFNYDAPKKMDNSRDYYSTSNIQRNGNTYYQWNDSTQSYKSYNIKGNDIYGSDGSHYKIQGNQIQGQTNGSNSYQINGNLIQPLY